MDAGGEGRKSGDDMAVDAPAGSAAEEEEWEDEEGSEKEEEGEGGASVGRKRRAPDRLSPRSPAVTLRKCSACGKVTVPLHNKRSCKASAEEKEAYQKSKEESAKKKTPKKKKRKTTETVRCACS
jgi:hypothetical protein